MTAEDPLPLVEGVDGVPVLVLRFEQPMRRFRVLFTDGKVVDVEATRDDSTLRAWVLETVVGKLKKGSDGPTIAGVVDVTHRYPPPAASD